MPSTDINPNWGAEYSYASKRAKSLWGNAAWVLDQSELNSKKFIVSSGPFFEPRHYGEGESWDEAFIDAGSSLFEPIPAYKFDAEDREILDRKCSCGTSTGIHGGLTRGNGNLDVNGYWEFPCTHGADSQPVVYTDEQRDRDKGRNWNKDTAFIGHRDETMYCIDGQIMDRHKAIGYLMRTRSASRPDLDAIKYLDLLPTQTGVKSIDCTLKSLKEYCQYLMDHQCILF